MESLILKTKIQLVQVTSNCHSKRLYKSPVISIGVYHENDIYRLLFKIPINMLPKDIEIVAAKLKLSFITKRSKNVNIITPYALTRNWDFDRVTWYNQPDFNPEIFGESVNVKEESQYGFDITTIVKKWHTNELDNNGILLKNQEIKSRDFEKSITDIEKSYLPKVEIFYNPKFPCESTSTEFINKCEKLETNDSYSFSKLINTSLAQTVMFFVKNLDKNEVIAHLQVSPDGINFINEPTKICVEKNKIKFIVPCIFAKFTRVAVKNIHHGETSKVKIWYQAQE